MVEPLPRPWSVTVAGFVALAASAVVATYVLVTVVTLVAGGLPDGQEEVGPSRLLGLSVAFIAWSLGAAALAWFTLRGSSGARWFLIASAAVAGAVSFTAAAFVAGAVIPLSACVLSITLLMGSTARAWFRVDRA